MQCVAAYPVCQWASGWTPRLHEGFGFGEPNTRVGVLSIKVHMLQLERIGWVNNLLACISTTKTADVLARETVGEEPILLPV